MPHAHLRRQPGAAIAVHIPTFVRGHAGSVHVHAGATPRHVVRRMRREGRERNCVPAVAGRKSVAVTSVFAGVHDVKIVRTQALVADVDAAVVADIVQRLLTSFAGSIGGLHAPFPDYTRRVAVHIPAFVGGDTQPVDIYTGSALDVRARPRRGATRIRCYIDGILAIAGGKSIAEVEILAAIESIHVVASLTARALPAVFNAAILTDVARGRVAPLAGRVGLRASPTPLPAESVPAFLGGDAGSVHVDAGAALRGGLHPASACAFIAALGDRRVHAGDDPLQRLHLIVGNIDRPVGFGEAPVSREIGPGPVDVREMTHVDVHAVVGKLLDDPARARHDLIEKVDFVVQRRVRVRESARRIPHVLAERQRSVMNAPCHPWRGLEEGRVPVVVISRVQLEPDALPENRHVRPSAQDGFDLIPDAIQMVYIVVVHHHHDLSARQRARHVALLAHRRALAEMFVHQSVSLGAEMFRG
mmetsp:Transcript_11768/g.25472  ORF Transcript_11768/g.25472 Transcript_11768/m.25472 type:complete len:474 (-) Transcript_11768:559-1980(-)